MSHLQQQVLDAVRSVLIAGGTAAAGSVFIDRVDPFTQAQLPAIVVRESDNGETVVDVAVSKLEERVLEVEIFCIVAPGADAPATAASARDLGLAVEKIIHPSAALRAIAKKGRRILNSRLGAVGEGDRMFSARFQTWQFSYFVNPATPDVVA
jgi:hypothetical protein